LDFAAKNAAELEKAVADADREKVVGTTLSTSAKMKRGGMVEILMGEVEDEKNPVSGAVMNRRKDVGKPGQMVEMMWCEPSASGLRATLGLRRCEEGDRSAEGPRPADAADGPAGAGCRAVCDRDQHAGAVCVRGPLHPEAGREMAARARRDGSLWRVGDSHEPAACTPGVLPPRAGV